MSDMNDRRMTMLMPTDKVLTYSVRLSLSAGGHSEIVRANNVEFLDGAIVFSLETEESITLVRALAPGHWVDVVAEGETPANG